jgi:hypothetical protein
MQLDAEKHGVKGIASFYTIFNRGLRPEVSVAADEWMRLIRLMRETPADNSEELSRQLKDLLKNNSRWLAVVGQQFLLTVDELDETYGTNEGARRSVV